MTGDEVDSIQRAIGRLQGQYEEQRERQDERHAELLARIEHIHDCIEDLKRHQWTRAGMWKAAGLIGGGAGAVVGAASPFVKKIFGIVP